MFAHPERATILIIDDTPANLSLLGQILKTDYRVKLANNGQRALDLAMAAPPDLILCDVMMPDIDGFEVCRRLKAELKTAKIPVIFITASMTVEDEQTGFKVGAVDYIHKPITPPTVMARIKTHLQIKQWHDFLEDQSIWLQREVARQIEQVVQLQSAAINIMVSMAEFRDEETGNHIRRTQEYVYQLAIYLQQQGQYPDELTPTNIEYISQAAPLHDIGKTAIPDYILLKPGQLNAEEFELMRTHSLRGYEIIEQARHRMGEDNLLLFYGAQITRHHHERWDGTGYPDGLIGTNIPLSARIMAIADVYDAVRSVRPYKRPFSHAESVGIINQGRGKHFDPDIVDAFLAIQDQLSEIATRLAD
ncbi:two-component system response regulator [Rhodoferax sp. 4810]|uniref:Two-component system response regulator n=1 Tax=Thiospirillum jenense TaxID=1653858 RepID=A0A839HCS9_9GAMM|nr:two-component system response regulator [Thiospirillum jenense]MBB1073829.1 two-component system response regulator [Rhodoferax jenense]MBB1125216.1 two-component system response regulator [Thiospirillum jenense]